MILTRRALVCCATLALAGRPVAQERTRLVFATAGQGSAFLAFGKAVAPVAERYVPVAVEIRETKGSNENVELVGAGQVQIATLNMGPAHDAWNGQGPFARRQLRGYVRDALPRYCPGGKWHHELQGTQGQAGGRRSVRRPAGGVLPRPRRDAHRQGDARRRHAGRARAEAPGQGDRRLLVRLRHSEPAFRSRSPTRPRQWCSAWPPTACRRSRWDALSRLHDK